MLEIDFIRNIKNKDYEHLSKSNLVTSLSRSEIDSVRTHGVTDN